METTQPPKKGNMITMDTAQEALKKFFGYDTFRPMQAEIIQAVFDKKDAVVLMPTGGGKSVCYQIPAVTLEGLTLVVSPLISLMKDQVDSLNANGIPAAYLNSSLGAHEQRNVEDEVFNGHVKLLYVSPEKMVSQSFLPLIKETKISLFAIDEAHCISSWGHDFRPEYTKMKFLKQQFADVPMIALTATADKLTRKDIVKHLGLKQPEIFIASFDRPNISLEVRPGQKRIEQILKFIKKRPNTSGIIYCLSRKNTEDVASRLISHGIKAGFYHAGLSDSERTLVQEEFINDNLPVVCATVAFGMGIDKSNVRWVIHYNLPKNVESYYQEIGRAGRDGATAEALMFYSFRDVIVLRDILSKNDTEHLEIKLSKLERMKQFADSLICRRKILLNYFSENLVKNCGNCDVCKNPPQYFDGTVIAQKALSAIARLKQNVGITMLIDVLRGSRRKEILTRGYDRIKTYGAGADISSFDWQHLLNQMINLGLLEIAYDNYNVLKLTDASKAVLFDGRKIQLVKMASVKKRLEKQKQALKPRSQRQRVRDELFEKLRALRKALATRDSVPPYVVFSDKTLEEMAAERPTSDMDMRAIHGVGDMKMKKYGRIFIKAILEFIEEKSKDGKQLKGTTQTITYQMYKRGIAIEEIAQHREMSPVTILGHLVDMYLRGEDIDIKRFVTRQEIRQVIDVCQTLPEPYKLKDIFEKLGEEISYAKIRFALAYIEKNG